MYVFRKIVFSPSLNHNRGLLWNFFTSISTKMFQCLSRTPNTSYLRVEFADTQRNSAVSKLLKVGLFRNIFRRPHDEFKEKTARIDRQLFHIHWLPPDLYWSAMFCLPENLWFSRLLMVDGRSLSLLFGVRWYLRSFSTKLPSFTLIIK